MRAKFERLETRRLLTVSVEVVQDPVLESEVGDEVTRIVRIFTDEATKVRVRSSLESELDNPTWERVNGHGKYTDVEPFSNATPDFRLIQEFANLTPAGDLNGDGRSDFFSNNASEDLAFVFGGVEEDIRIDSSLDPQSGVVLKAAVTFPGSRRALKAIGDVNGDGFDDLVAGNKISFGGSDFARRESLLSDSDVSHFVVIDEIDVIDAVGDVNGDGFDDMVAVTTVPLPDGTIAAPYLLFGGHHFNDVGQVSRSTLVAEQRGVRLDLPGDTITVAFHRAGDFNGDGFDDVVVLRSIMDSTDGIFHIIKDTPQLLYGGEGFPSRFIELPEFNTIKAQVIAVGPVYYTLAGSGDVNGDEIDDLVFSFTNGDCFNCTGTDRPWVDVDAGVVVAFGGHDTETGAYRPKMSENWNIKLTVAVSEGVDAFVQDMNGDGLADIHISASLNSNLHRREYVMHGGPTPLDVDLRHAYLPYEGFDGQSGYGFETQDSKRHNRLPGTRWFDINGDGHQDAVYTTESDAEVFLGGPTTANPFVGNGAIDEILTLTDNGSVIYTITGTKKTDTESTTTIAMPLSDIDERHQDNIASDKNPVAINLGISETKIDDSRVQFEIQLTNDGPYNAESARLVESITSSLQDVSWERREQVFPNVISLDTLKPGHGATLASPEQIRLGPGAYGRLQSLNRRLGHPVYRELGAMVGTSGDTNGDGLSDIFLTSASDRNRGETYSRLEFLGAVDFGADGEFPTVNKRIDEIPISQPPVLDPPMGDINGDGFVDRVQLDNRSVHVLYGNAEGNYPDPSEVDGTNGFAISGTGAVEEARVGFNVAVGDLDDDGFDDVIVADAFKDFYEEPVVFWDFAIKPNVYVIFGRKTQKSHVALSEIQGEAGFRIESQSPGDISSHGIPTISVASGFDVNGDDIDDLLIGNPFAGEITHDESILFQHHGEAYVIFGRRSSVSSGSNAINELVDLPVGAEITYSIAGSLQDGIQLTGRAELQLAPEQVDLFMNDLIYTLDPLAGDIDQNGKVAYGDFLILSANFGKSDADRRDGDLDGDGLVSFADFLLLSKSFS